MNAGFWILACEVRYLLGIMTGDATAPATTWELRPAAAARGRRSIATRRSVRLPSIAQNSPFCEMPRDRFSPNGRAAYAAGLSEAFSLVHSPVGRAFQDLPQRSKIRPFDPPSREMRNAKTNPRFSTDLRQVPPTARCDGESLQGAPEVRHQPQNRAANRALYRRFARFTRT